MLSPGIALNDSCKGRGDVGKMAVRMQSGQLLCLPPRSNTAILVILGV